MKKRKKIRSSHVGATEFKARCLELMQQVHDRQRNSLLVTKRGKPFVCIVPIVPQRSALDGSLRGLARIHGDLTAPIQAEWDALAK